MKKEDHLVSAGGLVIRNGETGLEVVLCGRYSPRLWALPKGTPESGESRSETALREVSEETGLDVRTTGPIDKISYRFISPHTGVWFRKTVYFYLMEVTGGDMSDHDNEFDEVMWFSAEEALKKITYENEAKIVEKGLSLVSEKR
ncbi:MAG: NUDIX hydrolase [SAR202 cluster bacterium]|jgi:8-oxo-dGTP pyrophosphatase MutT (NUDIX family)|nr:NUDIX hydrolase [SAR202 cluster bacterium]